MEHGDISMYGNYLIEKKITFHHAHIKYYSYLYIKLKN